MSYFKTLHHRKSVIRWMGIFSIGLLGLISVERVYAGYVWNSVAIGGGGFVSGQVYHPTERNLLYARTDVGGAYRWNADEKRWVALNDDIGGLNNEFMTLGVLSIALDPHDPERIYLACGQYIQSYGQPASLLSSTNRGANWTRVTLPFKLGGNEDGRGDGERLSVDPFDGTKLLLGTTQNGIWRSTNRGADWTQLTSFTPSGTTFVLHDPQNAGIIYAGGIVPGQPTVWRTSDGGDTWAAIPGQPTGLIALSGKIDAAGTLYLTYSDAIGPNGAGAGTVVKLANAATTTSATDWKDISPPKGVGGFSGVALDPQRPGTVLISTLDRWSPRDEIFLSNDGGATWKGVLDGAPLDRSQGQWSSTITPHWISDVEIDPFNSSHANFNTGFGVWSTDNLQTTSGKPTWTFNNPGLEETVPLGLVSPAAGASLISAIGDFDGFKHDNLRVAPSARLTPSRGTNNAIEGAGDAPAVLVRIHKNGSISRDGGSTFTEFATLPPTSNNGDGKVALSADGARIVWCPNASVPYWSANDGKTWTASTGLPNTTGANLIPAGDRKTANVFYVYDTATRYVFRSTDGGATFASVSPRLSSGTNGLRSVPGMPGEIWASSNNGLRRLMNGGVNSATIPNVAAVYSLGFGKSATESGYPAIFIWGTVANVTGIFRSDDTGASWVRINDDLHQFGAIGPLTGDPRVFGRVYFGSSGRGIIQGDLESTPQASINIYEDALQTGWDNYSWATVNLAAPTPLRRGRASVSVSPGAYQAVYFNHASLDTSGFSSLGFWIHGGSVGGQNLVLVALRGGLAQSGVVLPRPTANAWTRLVFPLSTLGVSNVPDFTGFWIQSQSNATQPSFYLDDVALVGDLNAADWKNQTYADWRATHFAATDATNDAVSGLNADPDRDGRSNRLEWLLLRDPQVADASSWANISLFTDATNASFYDLVYDARVVAGNEAPVVKTSETLQTWSTLVAGNGTTTWSEPLDLAGAQTRIHWRVPAVGRPRWFFQLR